MACPSESSWVGEEVRGTSRGAETGRNCGGPKSNKIVDHPV